MPDERERLEAVRQWVMKAEHDLATATNTLRIARNGPTDAVCFHVEQCVEKYMKALLVSAAGGSGGAPNPSRHPSAPASRGLAAASAVLTRRAFGDSHRPPSVGFHSQSKI